MLRIPKLRCDEDIFTLEASNLAAKSLLESLRDLLLVTVDLGEINVTVAALQSLKDGGFNLTRLSLPSAKP